MSDYRLTVSSHVDAPRLARVFARGLIERIDISDDAKTAVVLMVSDAASDSVRSGHSITLSGVDSGDGCLLTVEGAEIAEPTVAHMPEGLEVDLADGILTIGIGTTHE